MIFGSCQKNVMIIMMDGWLGNELGKVGRVGFYCVKIPIVLFYCLEDENIESILHICLCIFIINLMHLTSVEKPSRENSTPPINPIPPPTLTPTTRHNSSPSHSTLVPTKQPKQPPRKWQTEQKSKPPPNKRSTFSTRYPLFW